MLVACSLVAVVSASPVAAQSEADPEYRAQIDAALREYKLGNFNEARAFFTQAHAIYPNARTLRGLGTCAYELRSYVEAIQWFEQSLASAERPLPPPMRTEIEGLLRQARRFVTRLRVSVEPTWAKLRIDARAVERTAEGVVLLDPGTHELSVEAPHHETAMRSVRSAGGEELSLEVVLSPRREAEARAEPRASEIAPVPSQSNVVESAPVASESSAGPWIVIAASATVAVTGGVFLGLALNDKAAVDHPKGTRPMYDKAAAERVRPFSAIGIAGLAVGGAGVLAGLVWKLSGSSDDHEPAVALDLSPTHVCLRGAF